MKIEGFVAYCDGKPVQLELSDEIVGGLIITDPTPVFKTASDAEEAALSEQNRYGSAALIEIHKATIEIGEIVSTVE